MKPQWVRCCLGFSIGLLSTEDFILLAVALWWWTYASPCEFLLERSPLGGFLSKASSAICPYFPFEFGGILGFHRELQWEDQLPNLSFSLKLYLRSVGPFKEIMCKIKRFRLKIHSLVTNSQAGTSWRECLQFMSCFPKSFPFPKSEWIARISSKNHLLNPLKEFLVLHSIGFCYWPAKKSTSLSKSSPPLCSASLSALAPTSCFSRLLQQLEGLQLKHLQYHFFEEEHSPTFSKNEKTCVF